MKRFFPALSLFILIFASICSAEDGARVEFFSPQGLVKGVRQVSARFSEPMTTFGDPRNESPFRIDCPEKGSGRWADTKNWVYDFDRDLLAGVSCSFTLSNALKSLSGNVVQGDRSFSFTTGGPAVIRSRPGDGRTVDEDQAFILTLDAETNEASVLTNARFSIEGMPETVGIEIVKGGERTAILKAAARTDDSKTMVIRCRQHFPSKAKVKLIWGAGIASANGVATTADQILTFTARDPFEINFRCERTNANAPCIPLLPMRLSFSSPVPAELAKKIVMRAGKKVYKADLAGDDDEEGQETTKAAGGAVRGIKFKGPFPEKKSFSIELPKGLVDDAGRRPANSAKFPLQVSTDSFPPLAKFAAPFGIVELHGDAAVPVTLRNVEPRLKARQLDPEHPQPLPVEPAKSPAKETVMDKAKAVGDKLKTWLTGQPAKPEVKPAPIKGKQQIVVGNREEKIIQWLRTVRNAKRTRPLLNNARAEEFVIPKPNGEKAFEVVGIPVKKPGFRIIELESPLLGAALLEKRGPMYVSTAALVTNLSAHFKWGRESSLVWVTSLDKGEPVPGAQVHIRDCKGALHWQGKTDADGIARIKTSFPEKLPYCSEDNNDSGDGDGYADNNESMLQGMSHGLFVFASKQDDLTFVHSSWDKGIEEWRFQLPYDEFREHTIAHTVFDRTLVRAGDTVHMKHFLRNHTTKGFGLRKAENLPKAVLIKHRGSGQRYEFPLSWKADSTAESTLKLPTGAALGFYDVYLEKKPIGKGKKKTTGTYEEGDEEYYAVDGWQSGFFRVEEFRVPLMKGVIEPPKEPAVNAAAVDVDLFVSHLSGGGAGKAPVKLRTQVKPRSVHFADYEDYLFANGKVETGVSKEETAEEYRDDDEGDEPAVEAPGGKAPAYRSQDLVLDETGALRAKIDDLPKITAPHAIHAELEFRDPNGEIQTVSARVPLWSSRLLVGVKPDSWSATPEEFKFSTIVVDLKGKPVAGAKVAVELLNRKHYSHRKRLVGGFYSYEHVTETKAIGPFCEGTTDDKGLLFCSGKSPVSGNIIVQATVTDAEGNSSSANHDVWIAGKGEWWFEAGDSDRIDLLPEKKSYEPGETARFQVRMPFRSATVLVTTEREGIIDAFVKRINGKEPVISVPVKGNHAPNVFVSALCVRGRVAGTKPTALFDAGKPSYRLGIGEIRVGHKAHELKVQVTSDREAYQTRSKAIIRIKVAKADGGTPPKEAEVAIAAVDEGLLALMPNNSWKLLDAMMGRRGHEIRTSTAQTQVVGRRHFGLKALPAGGGGGMRSAREMFDTLLIWKGRVKLDAAGEATVEVPLNDSLTSFAVVAVAHAGTGLFGTGRTTIRTTQDLMILSGLPQLVRQGDRFSAIFTVRNASNREMALTATAKPSWTDSKRFELIKLTLAPGAAKEISWPVTVPAGVDSATWEAEVKEDNGNAVDRIKVTQRVKESVPVQVYQATVAQVERSLELETRMPADAIKGRGGIQVIMRGKLTEGLGGVTHYMKHYPYGCMEQTVSRAISLKDDKLWKQIVSSLPAHMDQDGLVKYFPSIWLEGSPMLTSYILSISKESGRKLPDNLIKQMEKGLTAFVEGKIRRSSPFNAADLTLQKLSAMEALSQRGHADARLVTTLAIEPNLWPTSAVLDWFNLLKRTKDIPDRSKRLIEAEQIIRSRLNFQGTVMNFSTDTSDRLWWLMVSNDSNALRTLLTFTDDPKWKPDMPRLARGAMARQKQGSWETTIANAWGVVAMDRFSTAFEATPVGGTTRVAMGESVKTVDWQAEKKGKIVSLPWHEGTGKLAVQHDGKGKPWATVMSLAAIPLKEPISSGYRIRKTITPVEQRSKGKWSSGDIARVRLDIDAQSDMTWVAVNDPVPAGSSILGSGLGRDSAIVTQGEKNRSWPVFDERSFEAYRAYYEFVPKGKLTVEYTVRFNNDGTFHLPATRVEALYAPEMYGEVPNSPLSVGE